MLLDASESVVVIVDIQPTFLEPIHQKDAILKRVKFLAQAANLLGVPILHTEQNPARMGGTEESLQEIIGKPAYPKLAFSCMGSDELVSELEKLGRSQVILCGIETHICVNQTAHDLLEEDHEVILAVDAISARTQVMNEIGLARMRELGTTAVHTESILYEWLETAEHPKFKEALQLVKAHPGL